MRITNAFCGVEQTFVQTYEFVGKSITCYDNPMHAKEEVEDFYDNDDGSIAGYVVEVSIKGELFNVFDPTHRKALLSALPSKLEHRGYIITKEIYVLHLMGMWVKDYEELENTFVLEDTGKFFYNDLLLEFIEEAGFNGYVAKYENCSEYVVFYPNINLEILDISI
jgi:hypothetical protein